MVTQTLRQRGCFVLLALSHNRRHFDSIPLNRPVKDVFVLELTFLVKFLEQASKESIVRGLFEAQIAAVVHIRLHLFRIA